MPTPTGPELATLGRAAQAEARATQFISEAVAAGDVVAVNFLIAEKYIAALHALAQAPNQKVVIVPMDLASLAGTVGGLGQIAASALGGQPGDASIGSTPYK